MTTTTRTSGACLPTARTSLTRSADEFVLTLWTADPAVAAEADGAGVDRIGVDLERLGKERRQRGRGTWISPHTVGDLAALTGVLGAAVPFARVNPPHAGSAAEVDDVIGAGARVVMLPMVRTPAQAAAFADAVAGRATVVLLVECAEAVLAVSELAAVEGVDELHLGLNDLALSFGLANRWLVFAGQAVAKVGEVARAAGLRFGLGGIGRTGDEDLPVPADLVYAEYARTGATAALLSRSFAAPGAGELAREVARARARLADWHAASPGELDRAHAELVRRARAADCW